MGLILNQYFDFVEYALINDVYGEVIIPEPVGWEDDQKEIMRHPKAHGKQVKFSSNLEFYDINVEGKANAFEFIESVYGLQGINAILNLEKRVPDPTDGSLNRKVIEYTMTFDYSTKQIINDEKGRRIKIKSKDEGLGQILLSRISEEVEIERLETMDGISLPKLDFKTALLKGRNIFLETLYDQNKNTNVNTTVTGSIAYQSVFNIFPITNVYSSDEDMKDPILLQREVPNIAVSGDPDEMFFISSKDEQRVLNIEFNASFDLDFQSNGIINQYLDDVAIYILKYSNVGTTNDYVGNNILFFQNNIKPSDKGFKEININTQYIMNKNEGLGLFIWAKKPTLTAFFSVDFNNLKAELKISETSFTEPTNSKFILPFELGERLVNILANKNQNSFVSNLLGRTDLNYSSDGYGSLIGLTTGSLIRGFENTDFEGDDKKDKRFKTSLKDFLESYQSTLNAGWGIEKRGLNEYLRFEKMEYFYQNVVTIVLENQVSNIKRPVSKDNFYSSVEVGNSRDLEPEEIMGLDEPNTRSTFTTVITRVQNVLKILHKYSSSLYNKEFARRKPKSKFPLEDTKYDSINFYLDLKRIEGSEFFEQRKWQDDFDQEPTGIFDPTSATELRLSPANTLLRHAWRLKTGLGAYLDKKTRYASSEGNSNLSTKLKGGDLIKENGSFENANFERSRFIPEEIEFDYPVDYKILAQVEGQTKLGDGSVIENFYGLVEFINEKNVKEYGYLMNLKPNKEGKWKLIKANI